MINQRFQELLVNFHTVLMREISQKKNKIPALRHMIGYIWKKIPRLRMQRLTVI